MLETAYKNWQTHCLPIAIFTTVILCSSIHEIGWLTFWVWMQFPVYLIHEMEEHAWPGGFQKSVNEVIFKSTVPNFPLTHVHVFWINIPFIWVLFPLIAVLSQNWNMNFAAAIVLFSLFNATLHILSGIIRRRYSPGLVASIFLNYPAGIYALFLLHEDGHLNLSIFLYAFLFALCGHLGMIGYVLWSRHKGQTI